MMIIMIVSDDVNGVDDDHGGCNDTTYLSIQ